MMYILEKTVWNTHRAEGEEFEYQRILGASDEPSKLIDVINNDEDTMDGFLNEKESSDFYKLFSCSSGSVIRYRILDIPFYG